MQRARKWAAVVLSTTLSLSAVEVALRLVSPRRTLDVLVDSYPAMFKDSDVMPYRLREGYEGRLTRPDFDTRISINSLGYRNPEFAQDKAQSYRVLAVGDSFTFGWGVEGEESYPARLDSILRRQMPDRRVEVINAGFAACYSPDTYYLYLKTEGLALKPDLILIGVFVGNDLDSQFAFENEWVETDGAGLPLRIRNVDQRVVGNVLLPRNIPFRYRAPVLSHSHVFQGLFDIWWELAPHVKRWTAGLSTALFAYGDDDVPYIYRRHYADRTVGVFRRVQSLFAAIDRSARESGARAVFVVIPDNVQLSPQRGGPSYDIDRPQRELGEFFDSHQIPWIDLLPWLREKQSGRALYLEHDGHWNALAHHLAAQRLSELLPDYMGH